MKKYNFKHCVKMGCSDQNLDPKKAAERGFQEDFKTIFGFKIKELQLELCLREWDATFAATNVVNFTHRHTVKMREF